MFVMDEEMLMQRSKGAGVDVYEDSIIMRDASSLAWALTDEERKCKGLLKMVRARIVCCMLQISCMIQATPLNLLPELTTTRVPLLPTP
jgi:hypothetical protein